MLALFVVFAAIATALPLQLPDDATPILEVQAGGVQIYRCAADGQNKTSWVLDHPSATLYRDDGRPFGMHGAGPMWAADDGSSITADGAAPLARVAQPTSVPWLALRVSSHRGTGVLSTARYVERFDTAGGIAPDAAECTSDRIGQMRAVHYSAVYEFFQ
jgi:hypothetical protein